MKRLKNGKAAGEDGILVEILKAGGEVCSKWLCRLFNMCWDRGEVPRDWWEAVILPVYKGKGDKRECNNHRGISVLSVVGKMYGRILIERVRALTDNLIGEEQGGFRKGRGCLDQVFVVKSLCEKFKEKGREVYMAFMNLEKAYDIIG